jgi:hypothetical protein
VNGGGGVLIMGIQLQLDRSIKQTLTNTRKVSIFLHFIRS